MSRNKKNFSNTEVKPKRKYTKRVQKETNRVEDLEKQVNELAELLDTSIQAQLESYQVSVDSENMFKALASEVEMSLNRMQYHCEQVQRTTGTLTLEDVNYCINLTERIIEYKFKKA